jgi:hypothetical protein
MADDNKKWPTAGFPQGAFVKEEMIKLLLKLISSLQLINKLLALNAY